MPSTFQAEKTQWVQPKIFIPTLIQRKKSYGIQPKNLSPHFSWQKLMRLSARITKNLQDVQISAMGLLTKRKQAKDCDILCLLQYLFFRNRNRIMRSHFRLLCFCYGSNSGVGSYTSIISRAANRNPIVNACSSCLSEISASAFFKLFEQSLLLFCERGSELRFEPHNGYKRSAFICAGCYTLYCFFKE